MSLVLGEVGYQLYSTLSREAKDQILDIIANIAGRMTSFWCVNGGTW